MRSGTYLNPFLKVFLPLVKAKIVRLWLFFLGVGGVGGGILGFIDQNIDRQNVLYRYS